tara:strand:+ start:8217 stop:8810 length:594 start_codon:yes stop_codon:yes gene_type:complete
MKLKVAVRTQLVNNEVLRICKTRLIHRNDYDARTMYIVDKMTILANVLMENGIANKEMLTTLFNNTGVSFDIAMQLSGSTEMEYTEMRNLKEIDVRSIISKSSNKRSNKAATVIGNRTTVKAASVASVHPTPLMPPPIKPPSMHGGDVASNVSFVKNDSSSSVSRMSKVSVRSSNSKISHVSKASSVRRPRSGGSIV